MPAANWYHGIRKLVYLGASRKFTGSGTITGSLTLSGTGHRVIVGTASITGSLALTGTGAKNQGTPEVEEAEVSRLRTTMRYQMPIAYIVRVHKNTAALDVIPVSGGTEYDTTGS